MISLFGQNVGVKILNFFIFHAREEIHIKGVAKKLKISPSTVKTYCDIFEKENLLNVKVQGNLRIFSLNNGSVFVKELKKIFALLFFKTLGIEKIIQDGSLAVYGSYASGDFDEESDIDLIVISDEKNVDKNFVLKFEKEAGKQVQLTILPYYKWEKMKNKKEQFALEVLEKHILIEGEKL